MSTFITVVHVTACFLLVVVVLIQSGKGAEISASFGGSSQTVFGSSGGANFFTRLTATLAGIFMVTSIALTVLSGQRKSSVFDSSAPLTPPAQTAPTTAPTSAAPPAPVTTAPGAKSVPVKPAPKASTKPAANSKQ